MARKVANHVARNHECISNFGKLFESWIRDVRYFGENLHMQKMRTPRCARSGFGDRCFTKATFVLTIICYMYQRKANLNTMKMIEKGDHVHVFKGTHKRKDGVVTKVHKVFISIRFTDDSDGKTLPSSVNIMDKSILTAVPVKAERNIISNALEYQHMSVSVLTELLAQGMAISESRSEKQLAKEMTALHARIREIRQSL
jgi:hypothetical protein